MIEVADGVEQVLERATEPVKPPHDQGVARAGLVEQVAQGRASMAVQLAVMYAIDPTGIVTHLKGL